MTAPDWQWTDKFGDTLNLQSVGADLLVSIPCKCRNEPAVVLDGNEARGLRAAIRVHCERTGV